MTYTLKDYDLKPGDWVNVREGWLEFDKYNPLSTCPYQFVNGSWFNNANVKGVLRPNISLRDELNHLYKTILINDFVGIIFSEVKPNKSKNNDTRPEKTEHKFQPCEPDIAYNFIILNQKIETLERKLSKFEKLFNP